jgi:hypothetical protein
MGEIWRRKMKYMRAVSEGNYVVLIAYLFGAIGVAYGASQIIGANPPEASSTAGIVLLALAAGAFWGVIGVVTGATICTVINAGVWSIPIILILGFLVFEFNMIRI